MQNENGYQFSEEENKEEKGEKAGEELASCAVCGRHFKAADEVYMTERGAVCAVGQCAFTAAMESLSQEELREFAAEFASEFLEENKWPIFEAATRPGGVFWDRERPDPLVAFAEGDRDSLVAFWQEKRGYFPAYLADFC